MMTGLNFRPLHPCICCQQVKPVTVTAEHLWAYVQGGMDVTLNSLTSPGMVAATLAGAARGGRVVEISKRDIWSPARVAQERPDVAYRLVAIDFLPGAVRTPAL